MNINRQLAEEEQRPCGGVFRGGQPDRTCFSCNKKGHVAANCPESVRRHPYTCFECGQPGHVRQTCPKKKTVSAILGKEKVETSELSELVQRNVNGDRQAMVDDYRLLNRIDKLKGKNHGEEDAQRLVYQDEVVKKLSDVELALRMKENETNELSQKLIKI